jgi:hypothetical protein
VSLKKEETFSSNSPFHLQDWRVENAFQFSTLLFNMNLAPNDLHTGFQRHLRCAHVLVGSDKRKIVHVYFYKEALKLRRRTCLQRIYKQMQWLWQCLVLVVRAGGTIRFWSVCHRTITFQSIWVHFIHITLRKKNSYLLDSNI